MAGSMPRWSTNTRFGFSANTLWPAPNVHPSLPGTFEMSFGQSGGTYAPKMSWPPFSLGTAAKRGAAGRCCADTH